MSLSLSNAEGELNGANRHSTRFGFGTMLSRISGFARDASMAYVFGATPAIALFFIAYRLTNILRRLFAEGAIVQGITPIYSDTYAISKTAAHTFIVKVLLWLSLFLTILLGLIFAIAFAIHIVRPIPAVYSELSKHMLILAPSVFFILLFGILSGVLQYHGFFLTSALAPVVMNCVWILGTWLLFYYDQQSINNLCLVVLVSYVAQGLWALYSYSLKVYPRNHKGGQVIQQSVLKKTFRLLVLTSIGVGAVQINSTLDVLFAHYASASGPAHLSYAIKIYQLPLALFALSFANALLPVLSKQTPTTSTQNERHLLLGSLSRVYSLVIPSALGLLIASYPIVNFLFGRGAFTDSSIIRTSECLALYAPGLIFASYVQIVSTWFFSKKKAAVPTKAAVYSVILNIALNAFCIGVFELGESSIALSTSISSLFNAYYLSIQIKNQSLEIPIFKQHGMTWALALSASLTSMFMMTLIQYGESRSLLFQLEHLGVIMGVFMLIYFGGAILLNHQPILVSTRSLLSVFQRKPKKAHQESLAPKN